MSRKLIGRMKIPAPPLSSPIGLVGISYIVILFMILALDNVLNYATTSVGAVVASAAWLFLVLAVMVSAVREYGVLYFLIRALGMFSRAHFIEERKTKSNQLIIGFGYRLLGLRVYYLKVEAHNILRVDWSAGQASHKTGRDFDDWHIAVWYRIRKGNIPTDEIYIATPDSSREQTTALGNSLLEFLSLAESDYETDMVGRGAKT